MVVANVVKVRERVLMLAPLIVTLPRGREGGRVGAAPLCCQPHHFFFAWGNELLTPVRQCNEMTQFTYNLTQSHNHTITQ